MFACRRIINCPSKVFISKSNLFNGSQSSFSSAHLKTCIIKNPSLRATTSSTVSIGNTDTSGLTSRDLENDKYDKEKTRKLNIMSSNIDHINDDTLNTQLQRRRRTVWDLQSKTSSILETITPHIERLEFLSKKFNSVILKHLSQNPNDEFCLISAWLISDNVIIDLFSRLKRDYPEIKVKIIAIDTLHLFPETIEVAEFMKKKYTNIPIQWIYPQNIETKEEFEKLHGEISKIEEADFDYLTKVEPLQRALKEFSNDSNNTTILTTGRRNDQGNHRTDLQVYEVQQTTLNPLSDWTWIDVTKYCQHFNVPVNNLHCRIYVDPFSSYIGKKERDIYENSLK